MAETFAALVLAHVLADFLFQSGWMVANKHRPAGLAAHGAVVLGTLVLCLGSLAPGLLALAALHLAFDLAKTGLGRRGLLPFALDQGVHLASLAALAGLEPDLFARGLWSGIAPLPALMALSAGLIAATRAGGYAIAMVMQPWETEAPEGLPGGGRLIGLLERALIFLLVLTGQAAGIGFLIAAKSVLRFSDTKDDRRISEYVIIGTLASFLWAIAVSEATRIGLSALPPLGISAPPP
jgi:hypothetical protein